ncbi:MAG TPA: 3'-5' exonuclease [Paludibacteraceae bacterium]|nr:3'-5' exonuclease [Paludibacteraceae bacterium]HOO23524.1 3'-5' exonuclease [Paludibacteraceae bacterium]HOS36828.1 3'-5' exonuclease [Paludibacteraceae bacterium]HPD27694.1 3'-5' exonuclease [Paludibacteraceae bacterium]HPK19719.1 3'-5' exonuclease [Paludibacteraceae bacterium]
MQYIPLEKILFLDIETVPQTESLDNLPPELRFLWEEKFNTIKLRMPEKYETETTAEEGYKKSAGIYSEFAKVVCISVGFIYFKDKEMYIKVKSFAGDDEIQLLNDFAAIMEKQPQYYLCGHNIKEFDIPFLCRRMLVNGITIPLSMNVAGKKPWETTFIDTLELWRFGDYKNYTSLRLLTAIFGIPTPKDDIDGSMVADVYYNEKNIKRISNYCEKDVVATIRLYLRMNNHPTIDDTHIEYAS